MRYIRSNSFKRFFSFGRRSSREQVLSPNGAESHETLPYKEEPFGRPSWKCFSYEDLFDATNGFSSENLVGKGGYAEVYKGTMNGGEEIAVKRLTRTSRDERKEKEFLTEIGTIGHVNHSNVLPLLGCCIDNGLYLVFELSSRGSVASLLHAKWLPSQWTHHSIAPIEGTFGHLAPEYYLHGVVDEKTDVFAFGVFLLEVISGRKPVDGSHQSLHSWAKPILNKGGIEELVDPRLEGAYDVTQLKRFSFAASLCIRASSTWRPTMTEVLEIMEEGERDMEKWKMAEEEEEEEEEEEFWGFEDLEYEYDSSFSMSLLDSIGSTG
ncbi:hypothetical protein V8G54_017662 [Vigna mungo]|uniref:Protein kinase domain-containing protein n=1 Tax=Vigna mungo TaxID=3915 RepID=A0AAQ3NQZ6_VIGMU